MKLFIKNVFALVALVISVQTVFAQAPQGLNYQAIARNNSGVIIPNQNIGLRLTITNGSGGSTLYQETQTTTTNQFGLFTINVGNGIVVSGTFSTISWGTVTPWLQVDMDATGGTSYVNMGTSRLLSVPYALFAASGTQGPPGNNGTPGTNGATWLTGTGTPSGGTGIVNDLYLNTANGDYYKKTGATSWTIQGSLAGTPGSANINGTTNYLVKFTGATTGGNSLIYDNGTFIGIGTSAPGYPLHVVGTSANAVGVVSNADATGSAALAGQNIAALGTGAGNGLFGATQQSNGAGVYGANLNTLGTGVLGIGNNVPSFTYPTGGAGGAFYGDGIGAYGYAGGFNGYGVYGKAINTATAYGVVGVANNVQGIGPGNGGGAGGGFTGYNYGVSGAQTNFNPGFQTAGGIFVGSATTLVEAFSVSNTHYKIWGSPAGAVSTTVPDLNGNQVTLHAIETPEFYFQDYGQSTLVNGKAHIDIDPIFVKNVVVNEKHPLRVFVQLEGDCKGVYVTNKTASGFDVVELDGGASNVSFQWSITCNVADAQIGDRLSPFADLRFEPGPINVMKNLPENTNAEIKSVK